MNAANGGRIACGRSGTLTERAEPPRPDEIEVALFGPGYGECAVVHAGGGDWIVVDSFRTPGGRPVAMKYLEELGLDPARSVRLIVATHWHDDHMKGLGELVSRCPGADFCCASALGSREFMSVAAAWAETGLRDDGIREIHTVMSHLDRADSQPVWALASRRIHRSSSCEVWSLSPGDEAYSSFLASLAPHSGTGPLRGVDHLKPNRLSVVLLVRIDGGVSCLFGADLERRGWAAVLRDGARPQDSRSSVFKVPHHGSANAQVQAVWDDLLEPEPVALLAPWRRGRGALPKEAGVDWILARTPNAYATVGGPSGAVSMDRWVRKKLKRDGARVMPESGPPGMIRLRRSMAGESVWRVDLFGTACHLKDFAA